MSYGRAVTSRTLWIAACVVSLISVAQRVEAQRYRRIEVPLAHVEDFAAGLRPVPRHVFESLVNPRTEIQPSPFASAVYEASLEDGVIAGTGTLETHEVAPLAAEQQILPLAGNLAITSARWRVGENSQQATVGRDGSKTYVVASTRSHRLEIDWNCRSRTSPSAGESETATTHNFEIDFPNAFSHHLLIQAPANYRIRAANALVVLDGSAPKGKSLWSIRWSGRQTLRFNALPVSPDNRFNAKIETRYRIRASEVRVDAKLRLSGETDDKVLALQVPPMLDVVDVSTASQPLIFTPSTVDEQVLLVELPSRDAISPEPVEINLVAVGQFPQIKLQELPRIRPLCNWTSESIRCRIAPMLTAVDLRLDQCVCESLKLTEQGDEEYRFELTADSGSIQFKLDQEPRDFFSESVVVIRMQGKSVLAEGEIRFQPREGQLHQLVLEVETQNGWELVDDSVDAIADSDTLPISVIAERPKLNGNQLFISLDKAATATRPIHVRYKLRNDFFSNETVVASQLVPVRVRETLDPSTWIYVQDSPGLELSTQGDEYGRWQRADEQVPSWIKDTLDRIAGVQLPQDMFLRETPDAQLVAIRRTEVQTLPKVKSSTKIEFGEQSLHYSFDLEVDPRGKELDHLVVSFSNPTSSNDWTIADRAEVPVVQRTMGVDKVDRHELRFKATTEPFQLHFEFRSNRQELPETVAVPLATVENTQGGAGIVALTADGLVNLDILPTAGLDSIPNSAMHVQAEEQRYRAVFRYDDTSASIPSLRVKYLRRLPSSAILIWRADLRSFYSERGRPRHRADFYVQSEGSRDFQLRLHDDLSVESIEVDGQPLDSKPQLAPDTTENAPRLAILTIPLPADNRYPTVTVKYLEPARSLGAIDWLAAPMPRFDYRSMQQTWQVWLPKDYRFYEASTENNAPDEWMKRLFGYFGSSAAAEFETSLLRSFRRRWVPHLDDSIGRIRQIEVLLGPDWPFVAGTSSTETINQWGPRLLAVANTVTRSRPGFELLIDREELRRIGIFADASLPKAIDADPRHSGMRRLAQDGLVLVVHDRKAIITSSAAALRHAENSDWVDRVSVDGQASWFGASRLIPVEHWNANRLERLWRPSRDDLEIGLLEAGWMPYRMNIATQRPSLKIYHRDTTVAACCIVFCFGFALGWWLLKHRRRAVAVAICGALAASMLLPQPGATFACSLAWSLVASLTLRITMTRRRKQKLREPVMRRLEPTRAAIWIVLVLGASGLGNNTLSAQESTTPQNDHPADVMIYMPVDENRNPQSWVYMPDDFYQYLRRHQTAVAKNANYWVTEAKYLGTLPLPGEPMRLTVKYQVLSLVNAAKWELPQFGETARVDIESVRVNRQATSLEIENGVSWLTLARSGDYEISFDLVTPWTRSLKNRRLDLNIAAAPIAVLQLNVPRGASEVRIPSAIGRIAQGNGILTANLGPCSILSIETTADPDVDEYDLPQVDRLVRLHVGDVQTRMEVDFESAADPAPLALQLDKRLVSAGEPSITNWSRSTQGTLQFVFDSPSGRFVIPDVSPRNAKIAKTVIAVSSGAQKKVKLDNGGTSIGRYRELEQQTDDGQQRLDVYVESPKGLPYLDVTDSPTTEAWTSELSFFFDQLTTRVEVKAQLTPTYEEERMLTTKRLRIPAYFQVNELTATSADGVPQRLRWHRNGDEIAVFFLDELAIAATSPLEIDLQGVLTTGANDSVALPVVELISGSAEVSSVRDVIKIYRTADINVNMDGIGPFVPEAVDRGTMQRDGYRMYGAWSSETVGFQSAPDALTVRRQTLRRSIRGSMTTRLIHDGEWNAEIEASLRCNQGIEVVYFDVPSSLCVNPPTAFAGEDELRVDVVRGGPRLSRRIVAVWLPDEPIVREQTITLTASLTQDQTSLPHVRLINVELDRDGTTPKHFVELPRRSRETDGETDFSWRRSGLTLVSDNGDYVRFRVSQESYDALLEEQQSGLEPEISLLSTKFIWRESGQFLAMSEYDLKPARQSRLLVSMPQDAEILQVFCNDYHTMFAPTSVRTDGARRVFQFALASTPWPQRVRIIYQGVKLREREATTLEAPQLLFVNGLGERKAVVVQDEVWSIDAPRSFGELVANPTDDFPITEPELLAARISGFVELWSRAQASIRERPRKEKAACLSIWAGYLANAMAQRPPTTSGDSSWQELEALIVEYPEAFTVDNDAHDLRSEDLWNESQWSNGNQANFISASPSGGEHPALTLRYTARPAGPGARLGMALGLLVAGIGLSRWSQSNSWLRNLLNFPHILVATAGILWWLLLSPSWIGLCTLGAVTAIWIWQQLRFLRFGNRRTLRV